MASDFAVPYQDMSESDHTHAPVYLGVIQFDRYPGSTLFKVASEIGSNSY